MKNISMLINTADKRSHIHPEIYGHFSEHLGRCIYNGMYVGENSEIPNINGVRKDVIEAFKEIKMPVLLTSIIGKTVSAKNPRERK